MRLSKKVQQQILQEVLDAPEIESREWDNCYECKNVLDEQALKQGSGRQYNMEKGGWYKVRYCMSCTVIMKADEELL